MPELDELLKDEPVKPYPFTKTWEENKDDPVHVNHTSGTTGESVLANKTGQPVNITCSKRA